MGTSLSTALPYWDPLQDIEDQRSKILSFTKGTAGASSTSTSSLASTANVTPGSHAHVHAAGIIMGSNAPPLYEHALVGDWAALKRRVATHPHEATYRDKCQNTCLHISCRRQPPPDVVETLIQANVEALTSPTLDGLTPLHFGCFCGSSAETIKLVLGAETNLRDLVDRRGRTPLHCVCAGFRSPSRLAVVTMLLELDPSCANAMDERGRTPLTLIVEDYAEELQDALKSDTTVGQARLATSNGDLYECWQVVTLLLRASNRGTVQEQEHPLPHNQVYLDGKFRMLHAALGVAGCPAVIIRLLLKIDPQAASEKDGDLNLPLHIACRTEGQPWSRKIVKHKTQRGVVVHNADFGGKKTPKSDDVTAEVLEAYPSAASEMDEHGKVPLVLAVESGKPWKTSLEPLWNQYKLADYSLLKDAISTSLLSTSSELRDETIKTLRFLTPVWPKHDLDAWVNHMIDFTRESPSKKDEAWFGLLQASALEGLASILETADGTHLKIPTTPQQALEIALPLLFYEEEEQVRVASARVLGASVGLLGLSSIECALRDYVFFSSADQQQANDDATMTTPMIRDDCSLSTMGHSFSDNMDSVRFSHGRAMACHFVLEQQEQFMGQEERFVLTARQAMVVKEWMKHESKTVRKAACLAVGSILHKTNHLREYKSVLLKCMRATEDASVHLYLGKALASAAKRHKRLFLCKAGLPLLDAALMLSMSKASPPSVHKAFHTFLWYALESNNNKNNKNNNDLSGLQEYMQMAEGENGRIMMSLVNRTLSTLPVVQEEGKDQSNICNYYNANKNNNNQR